MPEKSRGILREGAPVSEKYSFIEAENATMARGNGLRSDGHSDVQLASVSRSGFYEWRSRAGSAAAKRRNELKLLIAEAFEDSDGTYGYRRVALQTGPLGVQAGLELVRGLMRELALVPCEPAALAAVNHPAGPGRADPRSCRP